MMPVSPEAPISVYVPCRNGASTLQACLEALLSQTYPVAEIIVVDDGSTDATASIAVAVGGSVRAVSHPVHLGLAQARNTALAQVRHELVASVDADVVPEPEWLECMVRAMSTRATALVAGRLVASDRLRIADRWRMAHLAQDAETCLSRIRDGSVDRTPLCAGESSRRSGATRMMRTVLSPRVSVGASPVVATPAGMNRMHGHGICAKTRRERYFEHGGDGCVHPRNVPGRSRAVRVLWQGGRMCSVGSDGRWSRTWGLVRPIWHTSACLGRLPS